jgi:hypothetical protein
MGEPLTCGLKGPETLPAIVSSRKRKVGAYQFREILEAELETSMEESGVVGPRI